MECFDSSKRGSLNLSQTKPSNQVQGEIDPSFQEQDTELWNLSVNGSTRETGYHIVDDDDNGDVQGWNGFQPSMDDSGSVNFTPGAMSSMPVSGKKDKAEDTCSSSDSDGGCWARCQRSCHIAFRPCSANHNPLPPNASCWERFTHAFMCPPHGIIGRYISFSLLVMVVWAALFSITGEEALPGGNLFGLYVLVVSSVVLGALVSLLKLPALLGMLAAGFMLRNIQAIDVATDIDPAWASALRSVVLTIILLRAGLGIDAGALKRLSFACLRLAFIPSIVDAAVVAVAAHFLLDFPWDWAFMLGFVLAAVSPAVVIPCLLTLQNGGYGVSKGIPTLTVAACSLNNVICISAFGIVLGISFSTGSLVMKILQGPLEVVIGVSFGIFAGVLLWYIPSKDLKTLTVLRYMFLVFGGLFSIFGSKVASFPGAGALGCLTLAFVAAAGWKEEKAPISKLIGVTWRIFEPVLFGLIGAEISLEYLDGKTVGLGIATLLLGMVVRLAATFFSVFGANLNNKEKLFMVFAWIPKATVQAAIGPVALDEVRKQESPEEGDEMRGIQLLTIAVLSILLMAPLGAILIALTGPKLLARETKSPGISQSDMSTVQGEEVMEREKLTEEEQPNV